MCVIVYQPEGKSIDKDLAKSLWARNSDGGGMAFINNRQEIEIHKAMKFNDWWSLYRNYVTTYPESPFVLHMRIATHGSVNLDNTHPFVVNDQMVMAHNGIIKATAPYNKKDDRSDTRVFIDEVLPKLPETWLEDYYLGSVIAEGIGASKLVFLTTNPVLSKNVYIVNQSKGEWVDGFWFSNTFGMKGTKFQQTHLPEKSYSWTSSNYSYSSNKNTKKKEETKKATISKFRMPTVAASKYDYPNKNMTWKELAEIASDIQKQRRDSGYIHHVRPAVMAQLVYCGGCGGEVTPVDIECDCFDLIDDKCLDFMAFCTCDHPEPRELEQDEYPPRAIYEEALKNGEIKNDQTFDDWLDTSIDDLLGSPSGGTSS